MGLTRRRIPALHLREWNGMISCWMRTNNPEVLARAGSIQAWALFRKNMEQLAVSAGGECKLRAVGCLSYSREVGAESILRSFVQPLRQAG